MSESRGCPPGEIGFAFHRAGRFEASRASRSRLLRALDNEEDGVSSAFLKGKQKGIFLIGYISFIEAV